MESCSMTFMFGVALGGVIGAVFGRSVWTKSKENVEERMTNKLVKIQQMDRVRVEQCGYFGDPLIVNLGYNATLLSILRNLFRDENLMMAAEMLLPDNTKAPLDSRAQTLVQHGRCKLLVRDRLWGHLTFLE